MKNLFLLITIFLVTSCADVDKTLVGQREDVLAPLKAEAVNSDINITLPRPTVNRMWSQNGGNSQHFMGHLASADVLEEAFEESFGDGGSKRNFLISTPVVSHGAIFTIDAEALVMARRFDNGKRIWKKSLLSKDEKGSSVAMKGAGVAVYDKRVYATTGFGGVFSLDMITGKKLWQTSLSTPIRIAPTVNNNRVFVQTVDNLLVCLDADSGEEIWRHQAATNNTILVGGAAPTYAANEDILVVAFSTGQVQAFKASTGSILWSDFVINVRGADAISSINTIKANPVIDGQVLYVIAHNNVFVAIDLKTGQRIWEKNLGSTNQPWVAGGLVYVLTNDLNLLAIEASSGKTIWTTKIPNKDADDRGVVATGPVLTQNRLLVATSNGYVFSISPYTGKVLGYIRTSDGIEVSPVVANKAVIFTTKDADLVVYK
ncbi:MAG: PQQ-binding-like beta-propeller repeat protein [Alphaproteobacteria bacterium]